MRPTLEQVLARCRPEGEHLIWTGGVSGDGKVPRYHVNGNERYNARRLAYEEYNGVKLEPSQIVGTCTNYLCLHRNCLHITTRSAAAKKAYEKPEVRERHRKGVIEVGKTARVLSPGQVELVLNSRMSAKQLARFLDRSEALVSSIRCGRRYADVSRR